MTLDELESKAKAATPGEWQHEDGGYVGQYIDGRFEYSLVAYCGGPDRENMHEGPANAAYIAAANPATMLALIARIRELEERDTELSEAAAQVLDDMGKKGLNCCGAAKADLRAALGEWPDLDFTLADAQAIIDLCDYGKVTPNV